MSGQRDKFVDLQSLQNGSSSGGCIEPTSNRVIGDGDSVEDVLCFDRRSSLVNTALGLMAYQVPQVCDLMMRHWMDMLHLLLRHDSLTAPKLRRMLDSADSVLKELKGPHALELIEALLKAAVHMKSMLQKSLLGNWTFVRTICRGSEVSDAAWAVEKILEYVSKEKEAIYCQLSPIARLHVWRLMPTRLKEDLSDLANESMRRPLLSLKLESGTFRAFGFMVASLALAPDLLNEVRRLLLIWSSSVAITGASCTAYSCSS